ncbi:MAG: hypothetical protein IJB85_07645 [Clostridia bacterium]|nr:hypothetical protein [Clostridia bacterium]
MNTKTKKLQRLCVCAALGMALCLFAGVALGGMFVTAHLGRQTWSHEVVTFIQEGLLANLLLTAAMLGAVMLLGRLLSRFALVKLSAAMLAAWCAGTLVLVVGAGVKQIYDFAYVLEGAELFARGNYKPLTIDYFHIYSYQLGICLPMEVVKRLVPGLNLSMFMQVLNVFLSAGTAGVMAALAQVLFSEREARAAVLLYVLFLPLALQCIYVYGTLPMLLMTACAALCLALYLKKRKARFGFAYVLCIAAAYMLKPNAAVPLIAMTIAALLDALVSRDWKLVAYAALGAVCAVGLLKLVILQYELRAGVQLTGDLSALARLVMGMQEGGAEAGWFNHYTEQFFPFEVTAQQEREIAAADLAARLAEMKADPLMTLAFFRDKLLSQFLEPSYCALWYSSLCEHTGALGDMTLAASMDGSAVRMALERCMGLYQKMLHILCFVGIAGMLKGKNLSMAAVALPVCLLGGVLYHMLFEAKAQYLYMYVILMMPVAAHGLCMVSDGVSGWIAGRRRA